MDKGIMQMWVCLVLKLYVEDVSMHIQPLLLHDSYKCNAMPSVIADIEALLGRSNRKHPWRMYWFVPTYLMWGLANLSRPERVNFGRNGWLSSTSQQLLH